MREVARKARLVPTASSNRRGNEKRACLRVGLGMACSMLIQSNDDEAFGKQCGQDT